MRLPDSSSRAWVLKSALSAMICLLILILLLTSSYLCNKPFGCDRHVDPVLISIALLSGLTSVGSIKVAYHKKRKELKEEKD